MKRNIIILALFGSVSFPSFADICAINTDQKHLSTLQSLISRAVLYDSQTPIDSIIKWNERILPTLRDSNPTLYFEQQTQLVHAYVMRGDISLAIDCTRHMYEDAKNMQNNIGIALSNYAIGIIYANTNLKDKAIESYEDALNKIDQISSYPHKWQLLTSLISVLLQQKQTEEAYKYIIQLKEYINKSPDHPITFLYFTHETTYNLALNNIVQAKRYLHKADSVCKLTNEISKQYILGYVQASYYRSIGEFDKALAKYNEISMKLATQSISRDYRDIATEEILLNQKLGRLEETARIYQELNATIDTIASQSYARQINTLKASYQIDQLEIENNTEFNKIILGVFLGCLTLLAFIAVLAIWLKKQQHKIEHSTKDLEQLRRNAENATRAKSVFLSNMSHEIRTPLNALSGFSSLLTEEGLDNATRQQCTEIIQQNSELLLKLINDVIDLSSLEFGKMQFSIEVRDVVAICKNVVDTVNKVKQTQAELQFISSLEALNIETDDSRLQQVLINLLINATKFTTKGSITLKLEMQSDDIVLFSVTDTGCGIPAEKQPTIFQRFEKLNENAQGSGLGLSICQLIIEHIGGEIWIDSNYTEGSRFLFTHPICQSHKPKRKEKSA